VKAAPSRERGAGKPPLAPAPAILTQQGDRVTEATAALLGAYFTPGSPSSGFEPPKHTLPTLLAVKNHS
jgi:hypothetical protein